MWGILIFVDIDRMVYRFSCGGSLGFGKDLLFKSILGSCAMPWLLSAGSFFSSFFFNDVKDDYLLGGGFEIENSC